MVKDYTVATNEQTFAKKDQKDWEGLTTTFENEVCDFLLGEIAGFTRQPTFSANKQSSFLRKYGLSYSYLQAIVKQHCPEFLAGLGERVINGILVIDCYSRKQNKVIYVYGGNFSNQNVVVHLSGLEEAVHTNHFIVYGDQKEIIDIRNLLETFAKGRMYTGLAGKETSSRTGRLVRVNFKTGQRVAIE